MLRLNEDAPIGRRSLGQTALAISEVGFGCGPTAALISAGQRDVQRAAVQRALELGVDYFDTAPAYGAGESERTLGSLLRELGATPCVATKVELYEADFRDIRGAILRSVEGSLERLARERITVLHLHNRVGNKRAAKADLGAGALLSVDDVLGPGGVAETFAALRADGLVEYFGCSAYGGETSAIERVVTSGSFDCLQVHYSLLNPTAWERVPAAAGVRDYHCIAARAAAAGMGIIAMRVLEAGALVQQAGSGVRGTDAEAARRASLAGLLAPEPMIEVALRFALSRPEVSTALVGFSDVVQIEAAVAAAAKGVLPQSLLARIEAWYAESA